MRRRGERLGRVTLRQPFYEQCYPGAVCAVGLSLGTSLTQVRDPLFRGTGQATILVSLIMFIAVVTLWFAKRDSIGYFRAFASAMLALLQGSIFILVLGFLLMR